jgi:type III pantothenate kinase
MSVNLLLDIGNSHIKTAIGLSEGIITNVNRHVYKKDRLYEKFNNIVSSIFDKNCNADSIVKVGISLLESKNIPDTKKLIKIYFNLSPIIISKKIKLPIKIKYKSVLGSDRICSATAAYNKFPKRKRILIIDFGTATTYNLVINGIFEGGMITTGLETSLKSLIKNTSLASVKIEPQKNIINKDTSSSIKSGIWFQNIFTVERAIQELRMKHKNLLVVATGGLSDLLYKRTSLIDRFDKNLVLEGINFILNQ